MARGPIPAGPIQCEPLESSFFRWARDIGNEVGPNWRDGLTWDPAACIDSHLLGCADCDGCDPENDGNTADGDVPMVADDLAPIECSGPAFTVYTGVKTNDEDGVLIKTLDEMKTIAINALEQHRGRRMARALVTENLTDFATDLTGGVDSLSFARAFGILLRNRTCDTWFSVPETAVPYLVQSGLVDLDTYTVLGQYPLIAVPTNTAPLVNDGASGFWIYAHGPVEYVMGPVYANGGEGFDEGGLNQREAYARFEALIRVESCRTYAVSAIDPEECC